MNERWREKSGGWVQSGAFFWQGHRPYKCILSTLNIVYYLPNLVWNKSLSTIFMTYPSTMPLMHAVFIVSKSSVGKMKQIHDRQTYTSVIRCFPCACMHTNAVANSISIGRLLQEQQQELWRSSSLHPSRVHLQTSHVALRYPV